MKRMLLTSIAAVTAFSVVTATAPKAHAFFVAPAVAAVAMGGALLTGAVVGSASANPQYSGYMAGVNSDDQPLYGPVAWTDGYPSASVAYGGRMCHPTHAVIHHHWRRVLVCE